MVALPIYPSLEIAWELSLKCNRFVQKDFRNIGRPSCHSRLSNILDCVCVCVHVCMGVCVLACVCVVCVCANAFYTQQIIPNIRSRPVFLEFLLFCADVANISFWQRSTFSWIAAFHSSSEEAAAKK